MLINKKLNLRKDSTKYQSIVFDLDDTLLDTSGILVPIASLKACQSLVDAGLNCSLDDCMRMRHRLAADQSHTEIFTEIVNFYGASNTSQAIQSALEVFYNPEVPQNLPLMPGAFENLSQLGTTYTLFLVTMGSKNAQE